jgi:hypothetical protein
MSVLKRGGGTFLVRVYLGRDPITKKRVEVNETVRGSFSTAKKRETDLRAQHYSGRLTKSTRVTVNALFEEYLKSIRHRVELTTYHNYQRAYKGYIAPYIGTLSIDKLRHSDFQQLFNFMLDEKEASDEQK